MGSGVGAQQAREREGVKKEGREREGERGKEGEGRREGRREREGGRRRGGGGERWRMRSSGLKSRSLLLPS